MKMKSGHSTTATHNTTTHLNLRDLAKSRKERQTKRSKHNDAHGDPTKMPGETSVTQIRYYQLLTNGRNADNLCTAGQRHLVNIRNALNQRRGMQVKLKNAQYICNPKLIKRFELLRRRKIRNHSVVYLFHGTGKENISSIATGGFLGSKARSGGTLIWFSRQSTYSFGFTMSKGINAHRGGPPPSGPSGRMFVCALLVAKGASETSNIGDKGQDVITMTSEAACLPLYLIDTTMEQRGVLGGMFGGMNPGVTAFSGQGKKLGGGGQRSGGDKRKSGGSGNSSSSQ